MDMLTAIFEATVRAGTPLLFATLGSILVERAGVMNLGLEGYMLIGAISGFAVTFMTSNLYLGLLAAFCFGAFLGLLHAFLCINLKANQVVSGLAIAMIGTGISGVWGRNYIGQVSIQFSTIKIPLLSDIPVIGKAIFSQDILVYISILLVPLLWTFIFKTKYGMNIRAVGEAPDAADSKGLSVFKIRYLCTIFGTGITAVGGAYLSLAYTSMWIENMTAGRGWISIALVIFSAWNPLKALVGAYIFGGIMAFQLRMQTFGVTLSPHILMMFPYIATILVMVFFNSNDKLRKKMGIPSQLGIPYSREEKN